MINRRESRELFKRGLLLLICLDIGLGVVVLVTGKEYDITLKYRGFLNNLNPDILVIHFVVFFLVNLIVALYVILPDRR